MNQNLCPFCFEPLPGLGTCPRCGHQIGEPPQGLQQLPVSWILDGKYRIGMTLGQGGFGITYLAYDMNLQQKVAIKEYFPGGLVTRSSQFVTPYTQSGQGLFTKGVDAFYREGQLLARFQTHPNIVHIFNFFRENNSAYFVMEYVEGKSLATYLAEKGGRLSQEETISLLSPIMDALDTLHQAGILHRDIAPDNIYLTKTGQVKLLDFGTAKNELSQHTHSSAAILKPGYAPIEQYSVTGNQGPWTDVYAMGAVIYRCLTGSMPPDAPDRITGRQIVPISESGAKVSKNVEAAVIKALSLNITDRWQRMSEFKIALSDINGKVEKLKQEKGANYNTRDVSRSKSKKKKSKKLIIVPIAVMFFAAVVWSILNIGKPALNNWKKEKRYKSMLSMVNTGNIEETVKAFEMLDEFRDDVLYTSFIDTESAILMKMDKQDAAVILDSINPNDASILLQQINEKDSSIRNEIVLNCSFQTQIKVAKIGDIVKMGLYEQDNDFENGPEVIEWQVLDISDQQMLLTSMYGLDSKPFNTQKDNNWETSSIRQWLNNDFYNSVFNDKEKAWIRETLIDNSQRNMYGISGGNDTTDKLFLLSIEEANLYFANNSERKISPTDYLSANGVLRKGEISPWWLRSHGNNINRYAYVTVNGKIGNIGLSFSTNWLCVRPAFWVNLSTIH